MGKKRKKNQGYVGSGPVARCAVCKGTMPDQRYHCLHSGHSALLHDRCADQWDCGCIREGDRLTMLR
jgi:hypothetical protein